MNADAHAGLFGHRSHLPDEVGVVLPDFFFGEDAAVRERLGVGLAVPDTFAVGAGQIELAPDAPRMVARPLLQIPLPM